jgi:hypothetical protein
MGSAQAEFPIVRSISREPFIKRGNESLKAEQFAQAWLWWLGFHVGAAVWFVAPLEEAERQWVHALAKAFCTARMRETVGWARELQSRGTARSLIASNTTTTRKGEHQW